MSVEGTRLYWAVRLGAKVPWDEVRKSVAREGMTCQGKSADARRRQGSPFLFQKSVDAFAPGEGAGPIWARQWHGILEDQMA